MAFKPFDNKTHQAIKKLNLLKAKLDSKSPNSRIEFATIVFQFDLYDEIISHDLFDYGLGGRDFYTCFEMGDGDAVVHGVMSAALKNDTLRFAISATGKSVWDSWYRTYESAEKQKDMFSSASAA